MTPGTRDDTALAFDYGERRIGVALASRSSGTASAIKTIDAKQGTPDWSQLDALVAEWQPAVIVVGVPYNMDDSESPMTARARGFAELLGNRYQLPVETIDERLTSAEAAMELREQRRHGVRTRRLRRGDIDRHSARLIAESWLAAARPDNQN